jgi:hypothetical protein
VGLGAVARQLLLGHVAVAEGSILVSWSLSGGGEGLFYRCYRVLLRT